MDQEVKTDHPDDYDDMPDLVPNNFMSGVPVDAVERMVGRGGRSLLAVSTPQDEATWLGDLVQKMTQQINGWPTPGVQSTPPPPPPPPPAPWSLYGELRAIGMTPHQLQHVYEEKKVWPPDTLRLPAALPPLPFFHDSTRARIQRAVRPAAAYHAECLVGGSWLAAAAPG